MSSSTSFEPEPPPADKNSPPQRLDMPAGSEGTPSEFSAYCAFRDDRLRLAALISRDLRRVACVGLALAMGTTGAGSLLQYLSTLLN